MGVNVVTMGGTREITATLHIERWVQAGAQGGQIFADLNALETACASQSTETFYFETPVPGDVDAEDEGFYGREINISVTIVQEPGGWVAQYQKFVDFIGAAFPGEWIKGPNEGFERPDLTTPPAAPAKCIFWEVLDYE